MIWIGLAMLLAKALSIFYPYCIVPFHVSSRSSMHKSLILLVP
jgi:hypothetical protein